MADEGDTSQLTNGESHEMTDMNDDLEKTRKNTDEFDDPEYNPTGTTEKEVVTRADSGVDINVDTDSDPNADGGGSQNGMVDEEDGLFESFAELDGTIQGLELSLTESELTEATERGSVIVAPPTTFEDDQGSERHSSFIATPDTDVSPSETPDEASSTTEVPEDPGPPEDPPTVSADPGPPEEPPAAPEDPGPPEELPTAPAEDPSPATDSPSTSPVPQPPDYPPPPPPADLQGALEEAPAATDSVPGSPLVSPGPRSPDYPPPPPPDVVLKCTKDQDTGECDKLDKQKIPIDVKVEDAVEMNVDYGTPDDTQWPSIDTNNSPEGHFVYQSSLDPGVLSARSVQRGSIMSMDSARSVDSAASYSSFEIPYERLEEGASENGMESDSNNESPAQETSARSRTNTSTPSQEVQLLTSEHGVESDSNNGSPVPENDESSRPSTSTPTKEVRQLDPEPPTPPELTDPLNDTLGETGEWPAPPTPIATLDPDDDPEDDLGKDETDAAPVRSPSPPKKPRRSVTSMHYEKPILAYEIEMDELNETTHIGSDVNDENVEVIYDVPPAEEDVPAYLEEDAGDPEELSLNEVETATEYENHEGGTLTGYDNATYEVEPQGDGLETPKYTPPGSPTPDHNNYETQINVENGEAGDKYRFVQHDGADEEALRQESRKKFRRKTDCKCICLSALCFLVMILAAAFAFFVAMFLVGSLDGFLGRKDKVSEEMAPPERPQGDLVAAPPIQLITVEVRISIELEWDVVYDFPSSPERMKLENSIINDLNGIFRWGITEYVYQESEILEFRRGPYGNNVFVEFFSYFYDVPDSMVRVPEGTTSPSDDELYDHAERDMTDIVYMLLDVGIDAGRLRSVTVEDGTLELLEVDVTRRTA